MHGVCAAESLTNDNTDKTVLSAASSASSVTHFVFGGRHACFFGAEMKLAAVGGGGGVSQGSARELWQG